MEVKMTVSVGEKLPEATLLAMGDGGPAEVNLADKTGGRKVAIFAVPGAFTPTCNNVHLPSFVNNHDALIEKGIDEIICVAVNDPFVMEAWGQSTGAADAGITLLCDHDGSFTRSIGLDFTAEAFGLHGRSLRYSMVVEDGVVRLLNVEDSPSVCEISSGQELLANC